MQFSEDLNRGGRRLIVGAAGLALAAVFCLAAGATAFVGLRGLDPPASESAPGDTASAVPPTDPSSAALPSAIASEAASTPTPTLTMTATNQPTATATRVIPTNTAVPPTATDTAVPLPDLVCLEFSYVRNASGSYDFTMRYRNAGNAAVGPNFRLIVEITSSLGTTTEAFPGEALGPGDVATFFFPDQSASTGTYTLVLTIDGDDDIIESDEGNNQCELSLVVRPPVTLVPATLTP